MNRIILMAVLVLANNLSFSQISITYKMADYEGFTNEEEWYADEQLYQAYKSKNYGSASEQMDSIFKINPSYDRMNLLIGAVSYDKTKQLLKAIKTLQKANEANINICVENEIRTEQWSMDLQDVSRFKKLCPIYPLEPQFLPASNPQYRDSIIKYFIWQSPPQHRDSYLVDLGYEHFYSTIPKINRDELIGIIFSKFDQLIEEHGFPTTEMVGSYLVQRMAYITVAHHPDLAYLKKHQKALERALPPHKYALIIDKIKVAEGLPQIYGTQATVCAPNGNPTGFYQIEDRKNVNKRRMLVGLHPLEIYEQEIQDEYNVDWSKKN